MLGAPTIPDLAHLSAEEADARRILDSLRRLVRGLRVFSKESEAKLGLSASQLFLLRQLQDASSLSLTALSQRTLTDLSSASEVVERLAKKGLVTRRRLKKDRRVLEISLSAAGRKLLKGTPDPLQVRLISSIAHLKPEHRRDLARLLSEMIKGAGLEKEKPAMMLED